MWYIYICKSNLFPGEFNVDCFSVQVSGRHLKRDRTDWTLNGRYLDVLNIHAVYNVSLKERKIFLTKHFIFTICTNDFERILRIKPN